jgi:hypothetical protein
MSRRIGYQGSFLTIWQEDVVLPSGREGRRVVGGQRARGAS